MNHTIVFDNLSKFLFVVSGPNEEVMFQQLISARPLPGVLYQALRHEVLESFGPLVLNGRWLVHHDVNNDATLRFVNVGRVAIGQFHGKDAETPDVNL